jgi:hypothetical protein
MGTREWKVIVVEPERAELKDLFREVVGLVAAAGIASAAERYLADLEVCHGNAD